MRPRWRTRECRTFATTGIRNARGAASAAITTRLPQRATYAIFRILGEGCIECLRMVLEPDRLTIAFEPRRFMMASSAVGCKRWLARVPPDGVDVQTLVSH